MRDAPEGTGEKIIVAVDGSPASIGSLPLARAVARQLDAAIEVIHVARPEDAGAAPEAIRAMLEPGDGMDLRVATTDPASTILEAAALPSVVLLALATHGGPPETAPHLGRVTQTIIARTRGPVLLIPPVKTEIPPPPTFDRLLVPFDGSPTTARALAPAFELASKLGASIDLLYVATQETETRKETGRIGAPRYVDQPHHEWPQWAGEVMGQLDASLAGLAEGLRPSVYLARGDVAAEVIRFAAQRAESLILLVRRSHMEVGRARTLREILIHAPCPLVLFPGARRA